MNTSYLAVAVIIFVDGLFVFVLGLIVSALRRGNDAILAGMLAEEIHWPEKPATAPLGAAGLKAGGAGNVAAPAEAPKIEPSSSRLIAFVGMLAIVSVFLGLADWVIWRCFTGDGPLPELHQLLYFLAGGATLFAPYAANQFRAAFQPPAKT